MPNGNDRNWIRARGAIEGFRVRFGHWPTKVRLAPELLIEFRELLFTEGSMRVLQSRLILIADAEVFALAEDEGGHSYSYKDEGFPSTRPEPNAEEWLGIAPDTPFAHED
jgi:hypothetical protein